MQKTEAKITILLILLIAIIIRLINVFSALPLTPNPDENLVIQISLQMVKNDTLNPHFFNYPSFVFYLEAILIKIVNFMHAQLGVTPTPSIYFHIVGRLFNTFVAIFSIFVIFKVGDLLFSRLVGIISAFFIAISPLHIFNSTTVTTDIWLCNFFIFFTYFNVKIFLNPRLKYFIASGIFFGLIVSSKYTGFMLIPCVVFSYILSPRFEAKSFRTNYLIAFLFSMCGSFIITSPYIFLDFSSAWADILTEKIHYSTGHSGAESNGTWSLLNYLTILFSNEFIGPIIFFSLALPLFYFRSTQSTKARSLMILLSGPILLLIFLSSYKVFFPRNIVSLIPAFSIASSAIFAVLLDSLSTQYRRMACIAAIFSLSLPLVLIDFNNAYISSKIDSRIATIQWINKNLPSGTRLAIEAYGPPTSLLPNYKIKELSVGGYYNEQATVGKFVDYVIINSDSYERFLDGNNISYTEQHNFYSNLLEKVNAEFIISPKDLNIAGPAIRVYKPLK